jgi:sirohydrochlorin cobaltochelatase
MSQSRPCLVLLAHGSDDPRWRQPFDLLQRRVATLWAGDRVVELAYLQFCEPTLEQALARCRERAGEAAQVKVVPLFMSGGGHLLRDLPEAVHQASQRVGIRAQTTGAIAEEPEVVDAMVGAIARLGN